MSDTNNVPSTAEIQPASPVPDSPIVVNEVSNEPKVGELVGQCKWWSDKLGYGFVTVQAGEMKGKDIFVHHSGVKPLNSNYKTLKKGEYINFDVTGGDNGMQAINVTGIGGGTLICDVNPHVSRHPLTMPPPPPPGTVTTREPVQSSGRGGISGGRGRGRHASAYVPRAATYYQGANPLVHAPSHY